MFNRFRTDSAGSTPARSRSKKARAATGAAARAFNAAEDEDDDPECVPLTVPAGTVACWLFGWAELPVLPAALSAGTFCACIFCFVPWR